MTTKFSLVKLTGSLAREKLLTELRNDVINEMNKINCNDNNGISKFKLNTEFTSHILSLAVNGFKDKKLNENLLHEFVVDVLSKLHNLNDSEKDVIKSQIEFLQTNDLVQKIPFSKQVFKFVTNFLFKKEP